MPLNLPKVPMGILQHLLDRRPEHVGRAEWLERVRAYSPETAFDEWCNYEGLVNYGPKLRMILDELRACEVRRKS